MYNNNNTSYFIQLFFLFISILANNIIIGQTSDTLRIWNNDESFEEYENYLTIKENGWKEQINSEGDEDTSENMNAHMGLTLIKFSWAQVDGNVMIENLNIIGDDFDKHVLELENFLEDEVIPDISDFQFFDLFIDNNYELDTYNFYDSLKIIIDILVDDVDSLILPTIDTFIDSLNDGFSLENFEFHFQTVKHGTADFTFYLEIEDIDTLIFNRIFFENQITLDTLNFNMNSRIDDGIDCLDSYIWGEVPTPIFDDCIDSLRHGIDFGLDWCEMMETLLETEPLVAFEKDTEFIIESLDEIKSNFNELDTLLAGKEYSFGPENEQKNIKPIKILESMQNGFSEEFNGFYWSENPTEYTFGGIFPNGPTNHMIEQISADAIIYSNYDDIDIFWNYLDGLELYWETQIDLSDDPDPHMGLAISKSLKLLDETSTSLDEAFNFLDDGNINLFYNSWHDIDISYELDVIENHLDDFSDGNGAIFIILVIEDDYDAESSSYDIQSNTDFFVFPFHEIQAEMVLGIYNGLIEGTEIISEISNEFYENIDQMIDLDLNPAYLDFSNFEIEDSPSFWNDPDLTEVFRQSNPNWLSLTDDGIEWFHNRGEDLENAFETIYTFTIELDSIVQNEDVTLIFDDDEFENIKNISEQLYNDFAFSSYTTEINDENVNLSSWFDDPPASFLALWENVVNGSDSSISCLLPDRSSSLYNNCVCGISGTDSDNDGICDDIDDCVAEAGASQACGCNIGIEEGTCDCEGNILQNYYCDEDGDDLGCGDPTPYCGVPLSQNDCNSWVLSSGDEYCQCAANFYDCNSECGGNAAMDDCNVCSGGNSGHIADSDDQGCGCFEPDNRDECGVCGGNSCFMQDCDIYPQANYDCDGNCLAAIDCMGECGGGAWVHSSGECILSIEDYIIPYNYNIHSIYPNPFNPTTNIVYGLPEHSRVIIEIYDVTGRFVQSLFNGFQMPGYHTAEWYADKYSSGMYFVHINTHPTESNNIEQTLQTQKILLIK